MTTKERAPGNRGIHRAQTRENGGQLSTSMIPQNDPNCQVSGDNLQAALRHAEICYQAAILADDVELAAILQTRYIALETLRKVELLEQGRTLRLAEIERSLEQSAEIHADIDRRLAVLEEAHR